MTINKDTYNKIILLETYFNKSIVQIIYKYNKLKGNQKFLCDNLDIITDIYNFYFE
jgi:hypothetical protein